MSKRKTFAKIPRGGRQYTVNISQQKSVSPKFRLSLAIADKRLLASLSVSFQLSPSRTKFRKLYNERLGDQLVLSHGRYASLFTIISISNGVVSGVSPFKLKHIGLWLSAKTTKTMATVFRSVIATSKQDAVMRAF